MIAMKQNWTSALSRNTEDILCVGRGDKQQFVWLSIFYDQDDPTK